MYKIRLLPSPNSLTIEQKIGQVCLFGFHDKQVTQELRIFFRNHHIGNVILFSRNFNDAHGLRDLCRSFYGIIDVPPFIAIDQEGGVVTRINKGATVLPGNMAVAATGKPKNGRMYGSIIGRELRALGVNLNLAPVLDTTVPDNPGIGVRSFGDSAEIVSQFGSELIHGLQSESVFACAKHFPGIGSALFDTHIEMPTIDKSLHELESSDLIPFKTAIVNGVDCVMTSHAGFSAFDSNIPPLPATFNPAVYTGYLRERLGFKGVIITDDLEMGSATNSMKFEDSVIAAVHAGADLLAVCSNKERQEKTISALLNAVRDGAVSETRIDESIARIFLLKQRFLEKYHLFFKEDIDDVIEENKHIAHDIVTQSITIFDELNNIPLRQDEDAVISAVIPRLTEITQIEELKSSAKESEEAIMKVLGKYRKKVQIHRYSLPPGNDEVLDIANQTADTDCTLMFSYNAHLDEQQSAFVTQLAQSPKLLILIMLRNPHDRFIVSGTSAIAVYAPTVPGITAALRRLFRNT